jgi:hypothetical protein
MWNLAQCASGIHDNVELAKYAVEHVLELSLEARRCRCISVMVGLVMGQF